MVVLVSPAITHMPPFSQEGTQTAKIEYNLNRKDNTLLDCFILKNYSWNILFKTSNLRWSHLGPVYLYVESVRTWVAGNRSHSQVWAISTSIPFTNSLRHIPLTQPGIGMQTSQHVPSLILWEDIMVSVFIFKRYMKNTLVIRDE